MLVFAGLRTRIPGGVRGGQIHDQADHRHRLVGQAPDAEAADFEHAGERRGRAHQQAAGASLDISAVVRHQPREGQRALCGRLQQLPDQMRFAGAGGSADQRGLGADENGGGVDGGSFRSPTYVLNPFIPAKAEIQP